MKGPARVTVRTGLDLLLADPQRLAGRRWALLAHHAAVTADLAPAHLALAAAAGPPAVLFGPEHGYFAVEQDMVGAADQVDPLAGIPIRSLYGDSEDSLVPRPEAFAGLDLLVVDLQDVGARYYTYAATAVWAAEVAARAGVPTLVLDRPNPLGGEVIEGAPVGEGEHLVSFVSAFRIPARHGLTLGELVRLEARRRGFEDAVEILPMTGWRRSMLSITLLIVVGSGARRGKRGSPRGSGGGSGRCCRRAPPRRGCTARALDVRLLQRPRDGRGKPGKGSVLMAKERVKGFLAGLFGVGGGFIIVPLLVIGLHLPYARAAGTS